VPAGDQRPSRRTVAPFVSQDTHHSLNLFSSCRGRIDRRGRRVTFARRRRRRRCINNRASVVLPTTDLASRPAAPPSPLVTFPSRAVGN